jgi:hypothetical protein
MGRDRSHAGSYARQNCEASGPGTRVIQSQMDSSAHESRGGNSASVLGAWLLGGATSLMAVYVAAGMIRGSDREFERGVAPLGATIVQEVAGAAALVALASVIWRLRRFASGDGVGATIGLFVLSIVLCLVWVVAYAAQHAS